MGSEFSTIEAHWMSPITSHNVWNIALFFMSSDLIMRIANFFSFFCAVLWCSTNYYVLRIAWWSDYIIDEPISVAWPSEPWESGRLFAWDCGFESNRVHPFLSLVSVVCCLEEVPVSDWSLVWRRSTEWGSSDCDLYDPYKCRSATGRRKKYIWLSQFHDSY